MKNVLTVLMAGGAGERLHPLTRNRAKPAVPFGGVYRIVDVTLSNCLNSDCRRIQVLVQYKSLSLSRHIHRAWNVMHGNMGEFIDIISPQKRINDNWFLGTADSIFQNLYSILRENPREVLIVSGDHIYKMDYKKMVQFHRQRDADLTIAAIPTPLNQATQFGVLDTNTNGRVTGFEEKPEQPRCQTHNPEAALVSMGVYVFNTGVLKCAVEEDARHLTSSHDFGKDIIPALLEKKKVYAYVFEDENKKSTMYWRDVGTIESYWEANMDLVSIDPLFNLYDASWPIRSTLPMLPPAKFVFASIGGRFGATLDSIVSPGCIISGGQVFRSVLSPGVRVNSYALVEDSILLEGVNIGRHARIRRAIIEKHVHIPDHSMIGYNAVEDAKRHRVTSSGIVVVESAEGVHVDPSEVS